MQYENCLGNGDSGGIIFKILGQPESKLNKVYNYITGLIENVYVHKPNIPLIWETPNCWLKVECENISGINKSCVDFTLSQSSLIISVFASTYHTMCYSL